MGGEIPRAKLDVMMSELRERLRHASEHAAKAREAANAPGQRQPVPLHSVTHPDPPAGPHTEAHQVHNHVTEPGARPVPEMWPAHLRRLSSKLDTVTRDSEKEFLTIGARLADFQRRAGKISEISEHVVRLITDKEIGRTIIELDRILFRMKEWLASCPPDIIHQTRMMSAGSVIDKTLDCLDSLQKKHGLSAHMLSEFLDMSGEISRSIGAVVESMQYNDITRQRLEHAGSEIRALADRLAASRFGPRMTGVPGFAELAGEAGAVTDAQAKALLSARNELGRAVESIRDNLALIARDTAGMADEIHSVTRGDGESGKSFLSAIGNWLGALTDTLSAFRGDGIAGHGELPEEFGRMLEELRGMVDGLHRINGNVLYRLSILEESGKTLSEEIDEAVGGITLHHRVAAAAEDVASGLRAVADEARMAAPDEMRRAASRIEQEARQHGRTSVHELPRTRDAQALGDNVELF